MTNKCEGTCCAAEFGGNERDGRRVHITGRDGFDWGEFTYCDDAIKQDEDHGFTVRPVDADKPEGDGYDE